jgi:hypothetical protein
VLHVCEVLTLINDRRICLHFLKTVPSAIPADRDADVIMMHAPLEVNLVLAYPKCLAGAAGHLGLVQCRELSSEHASNV